MSSRVSIWGLLVIGALPLLPYVPDYWFTLLTISGMAAIVVFGLVLLASAGITSFGQAAFVGIGAYASAVANVHFGLSPWQALPVSAVVSGALGWSIGSVTVRLSGHFLPLGTIVLGVCFYYLLGNAPFLGGFDGIAGISPLVVVGQRLETGRQFFAVVWIAVVLAGWATANLLNSDIGRTIRAIGADEELAHSAGVDIPATKLVVFTMAAVLAGLAGWLQAYFFGAVSPGAFTLTTGIEYLVMAVLGGAGSVVGALIGAAAVLLTKELLIEIFGSQLHLDSIAFGCVLVVLLRSLPKGLASALPRLSQRLLDSPARKVPIQRVGTVNRAQLLRVDGLSVRFGSFVAVSDVDLTVRAGEIVGLIGPNGAGKSTTFRAIVGLEIPSAGHVAFSGQMRPSGKKAIGEGLAYTFQHAKLVDDMTVLECVALGAHARVRPRLVPTIFGTNRSEEKEILLEAMEQLRKVGLIDLAHQVAASLAIGQRRLVELARALAQDPVLLLLDEPAAGLRSREKAELAQLLASLRASGLGIVLVEHDMDFLMPLADRIVVLNAGQKIAEGNADSVRTHPAVLAAYIGAEE